MRVRRPFLNIEKVRSRLSLGWHARGLFLKRHWRNASRHRRAEPQRPECDRQRRERTQRHGRGERDGSAVEEGADHARSDRAEAELKRPHQCRGRAGLVAMRV